MSTRRGKLNVADVMPREIRAVGYLRLSDLRAEDLTDDGATVKSFPAREKALREYGERLGWRVIEVINENDVVQKRRGGKIRGVSASKKRKVQLADGTTAMRVVRPGFDKILHYFRTGHANALIAEDLDRIMRDPWDNENLIEVVRERKINARAISGSLTFTDGGTDGEITMARVLVAFAAKFSADNARRVAAGRDRKALAGEFGGGPRPFGFEPDGVTIRPDEAHIIYRCSERVLQFDAGTKKLTSLRTLAAELRRRQVPTCTGAQWSAETLKDILIRPRNAGILVHKGEELGPAPWRPIVPVHLFRRVVALLTDPARNTARGAAPKWLGSGQFLCGVCNDGTTVEVTTGNKTTKQADENGNVTTVIVGKWDPRFRCRKKAHLSRNVAHVLDLVERATIARLSQPDAVDLLPPVADTSAVDLDALATEAQGIRGRLKDLTADYVLGRGDLSKTQLKVASEAAQKRLTEIDEQLKSTVDSPLSLLVGADDVAAEWHARTFGEQQAILDALWVVTILPQCSGGRGFKPEFIDIRERSTLPPRDTHADTGSVAA